MPPKLTLGKPIFIPKKSVRTLKPIQLRKPIVLKRERRGIFTGKTRREKRKQLERSAPFRFISSPLLTAGLAGTLGTITAGPVAGAKAFAIGGTAAGIVSESPKAAKFLAEKVFRPEKAGREIGKFIEDPARLQPEDVTVKGTAARIKEFAGKAGLIGGAAAAGIGAGALIRKGASRLRRRARERVAGIPSAIGGIVPSRGKASEIREVAVEPFSRIPNNAPKVISGGGSPQNQIIMIQNVLE